ncbi:hypothetical protein BJP25_11860 [Actinokineospora bangkokensis]|uniref:BON domain-containing protein n=1 Tax=Actinokineospora bangkokensis TaxID=1193682 RepID=A0A1Q9LR13_9PSEU|nr:hypothetical protein BJP25_11860 [Actinokineospora bangkokensis]
MATTLALPHPRGVPQRRDEDIKAEVERDVLPRIEGVDTTMVRILVEHGTVWLVGRLDWDGQAEEVRTRVARVPGVVAVEDRLRGAWDDHPVYRWHPHVPHLRRHPRGGAR